MVNPIERIAAALDDPDQLEALFRADPRGFRDAFPAAAEQSSGNLLVRAWHARLAYETANAKPVSPDDGRPGRGGILLVIALALCAGTAGQLPTYFPDFFKAGFDFHTRYWPFFIFPALAILTAYFMRTDPRRLLVILAAFAGCLAFAALAPVMFSAPYGMSSTDLTARDAMFIIYLHLPFVLLFLIALCAKGFRRLEFRLEFPRSWAATAIYTMLILLGGMAFSAIALGLFSLIEIDISRFYFRYVVPHGFWAAPIVALYLQQLGQGPAVLSSLLARTFAPLALVLLTVYLAFLGWKTVTMGWAIYENKDFLVVVNLVLLLLAALILFSLLEARDDRVDAHDWINFGLLAAGVPMGLFVLGACLYWIINHGLSPFRITALGLNMAVLVHILLLGAGYLRFFRMRMDRACLQDLAVTHLPVYGIYAAVSSFVIGPLHALAG